MYHASLICVFLYCFQPRRDVPLAMTLCMLFLFCSAVAMLFTVSCQYPGVDELSGALLPLNYGFRRAFGISYQSATWLTLPAVYGTAFGFMYDYSRQLTAMSKSGLMPIKVPCQGRFPDAVLYTYLFLGSGLAIVLMLLVYYLHLLTIRDLFLICILGGYLVYVCVLISYIIFQTRYSTLHREFRSPFGITGAVVGIVIFCISIFSAVALQKNTTASVFLTVVLAVVSMHYYIYARHHQKFSDDEQKTLFSAYIINGKQSHNIISLF
ncbi:hypothetical protein EON65_33310 [archaeon]|nr:MAG: hypothetical protein EON65_33310 [archaeon]